jgi:type I restriction enzyme S subunit
MEQQKNIPVLRFPEFSGEWEMKKLGEICTIKTGGKDTQNKVDDGLYPFFVRSDNVERINSYSFDGEAILTSGDGVGVGKNFHYINSKFNFHQRVYCLRDFGTEYSGKFIFYFFADKFYDRAIRLSAKNSVDSVRMDMISMMEMNFPGLLEQQKIATFLNAVDEKLAQLKKKKTLLEQYKKGVMQLMFSQEIRFKDDKGKDFPDWEEIKLGDVAKFSKGKGISKNDVSEDGQIECIRYGELYTHYHEVIDKIKSRTNINIKDLVLSEANDVIIPASGETQIDIATASCVINSGVALGGDLNIIKTDNNGVFLSYYLNNNKKVEIATLAQGVSVVHLYPSQLAQLDLTLPSIQEQTKIANFLSAIDNKINHTTTQIEKTKQWKKGLLQQLFV